MAQRYLYIVHEESGIPSTTTNCKKAKLDEVLVAHYRADLMTECMKKMKKKDYNYQVTFVFVSFSAVNGISFSSAFSFSLRSKMKNAFRSASSISQKKVLVLVLKKVLITYITVRPKHVNRPNQVSCSSMPSAVLICGPFARFLLRSQ